MRRGAGCRRCRAESSAYAAIRRSRCHVVDGGAGSCADDAPGGDRGPRGRAGARGALSAMGATLVDASAKLGVAKPIYLAEKPDVDPKRITGRSSKDEIVKAFESLKAAGEDDVVFVVLIGHGTFDGKVAKFNLPGPDMTPADFAPLLKGLKSRHVVFVNTASASGAVRGGAGRTGPDDRHARRAPAANGSRRSSAAISSTRSRAPTRTSTRTSASRCSKHSPTRSGRWRPPTSARASC